MAEARFEDKFNDIVIKVRRVTKVTKGGKRFSFSAFVVSGNKQGKIGAALGRAREVQGAIAKATARARKNMIDVALRGKTLPYNVEGHHGASRVMLRSAYEGTGVIAGGAVRAAMSVLGVEDVLAKTLGSRNPQNVLKATLNALAKLRTARHLAALRGKSITEITRGKQDAAA